MTQAQQRPDLNEDVAYQAPRISEATPESGREGDTITIRGSHLASVEKATFQVGEDTRRGEIVQRGEDNQVKVRVPRDLPAGKGQILVSNAAGESNRQRFTVRS
jgi:hypothetical protein